MNKGQITKIIVGLVIVVVAIIFFISRSGETPTVTYTIKSDDGNAQLKIPEDALPEGVSPDSISVKRINSDELPFEIDENIDIVAYRLEPDGTQFTEEVILRIPTQNNGIPLVLHAYNDEVVLISGVGLEIDGDKKTVLIPVEHFSIVIVSADKSTPISFSGSSTDVLVGETVNSQLTVSISSEYTYKYNKAYLPDSDYEVVPGSAKIKGYTKASSNISPSLISDTPPLSRLNEKYTINSTGFKCVSVGPAYLEYEISIKWDDLPDDLIGIFGNLITLGGTQSNFSHAVIRNTFECERESELPNFELHRADPPATNYDYDYEDVVGKSEKELKKLGKTLRIHAFNYLRSDREEYFPFPHTQFKVDKRVYTEHELGSDGSYCANAHFDAPKALDIKKGWMTVPNSVCGWGSPAYAVGALVVTPKQLSKWLEEYGRKTGR